MLSHALVNADAVQTAPCVHFAGVDAVELLLQLHQLLVLVDFVVLLQLVIIRQSIIEQISGVHRVPFLVLLEPTLQIRNFGHRRHHVLQPLRLIFYICHSCIHLGLRLWEFSMTAQLPAPSQIEIRCPGPFRKEGLCGARHMHLSGLGCIYAIHLLENLVQLLSIILRGHQPCPKVRGAVTARGLLHVQPGRLAARWVHHVVEVPVIRLVHTVLLLPLAGLANLASMNLLFNGGEHRVS
mmetsp:Transcript_26879/g.42613  ORF Transcript_26879/g.42613 Transcript_26879/m.42613 type:complete len:239 (-) Transcript_26879:175-891(-)